MCLLSVKEEPDYSVPARVTKYRRETRRYSPPPPRVSQVSKTRIIEERRPSGYISALPTELPAPPPAPSIAPSSPPLPPPAASVSHSVTKIDSRHSQVASPRSSKTRSHYVEVEHDTSPSSSSTSGFSDSTEDVRSRTTHKTSNTAKSSHTAKSTHTAKSSKSKVTTTTAPPPPPASEYSEHEKEWRRERAYSRPRDEWETYRYVNAPPDYRRSGSRRGDYDDPRGSRGSYKW